jgi:hypothetical protein
METLVTFNDLAQAQIVKAALEDAGIAAFIPDELTAQNAPPFVWAGGGFRLQVPEADADAARALLAAIERDGGYDA